MPNDVFLKHITMCVLIAVMCLLFYLDYVPLSMSNLVDYKTLEFREHSFMRCF